MSTAAFHAERRLGIGGSDAAAILNVSPYKGPLSLYLEKRGELPEQDLSEKDWIVAGQLMEPVIAEMYRRRTKRRVALHEPDFMQHPEAAWMICHPDGLIAVDGGDPAPAEGDGIFEAKNVDTFLAERWDPESGELPLHVTVQLQHNMAVAGKSWGSVAAWVGSHKLMVFDQLADADFQAQLYEQERAFWQRVIDGNPPEPGAADSDAIKERWPGDDGSEIVLPAGYENLHSKRLELKVEEKRIKEELETLDNILKSALGPASRGVLPGGLGAYTWKLQKRAGYVVEPTEFRVLRHAKR